jgi:hypothetical protein
VIAIGRVVAIGGLIVAVGWAIHAAAPDLSSERGGPPLVVVGVPGLRWADVTAAGTPTLWQLASNGSIGNVSIRTVADRTCPAAGWLTVGSGRRSRASSADPNDVDCQPNVTSQGRVQRWEDYQRTNEATGYAPRLGLLGDAARNAGHCISAVGPGAAVASADSHGAVTHFTSGQDCPVRLIDIASDSGPRLRATWVADIDRRVATALHDTPAGAVVLVAAVSDDGPGVSDSHSGLRIALARGPGFPTGLLHAGSTRQPGLVQLTDVTATLLDLTGWSANPADRRGGEPAGSPWRSSPAGTSPAGADPASRRYSLANLELRATVVDQVSPWLGGVASLAALAVCIAAVIGWRSSRIMPRLREAALAAAALPAAASLAMLVPWWRAGTVTAGLLATVIVALAAAVITAIAVRGPWRRSALGPPGVVAAITVSVLAADVITGSRLQLAGLSGYSPVGGGRFYGFGNLAFGTFAVATLITAAALADALPRRPSRWTVPAIVCALAVVVDAYPGWGSDLGGALALLPAATVLFLTMGGWRVSMGRTIVIGIVTVVVVAAGAVADWTRPAESRSHLGRFIQQIMDGDATAVIARKVSENVASLTVNPATLTAPLLVAGVLWLALHPSRWGAEPLRLTYRSTPKLRAAVVAGSVCLFIGFVVNDTGVSVVTAGGFLLVPLIVAATHHAEP